MTRHDTTRHDTTRHGTTRHDTTRHDDTTRHGHDTTRHDTTRHDTTRHDTTRHDTTSEGRNEDYRRLSKIIRFFLARNLPNLRQESSSLVSTSLTHSGDDEDSEDSGIISLFFLLESPESPHRTQLRNACVLHLTRHGTMRHGMIRHAMDTARHDTAQYDLRVLHTSRLGVTRPACHSAHFFKNGRASSHNGHTLAHKCTNAHL